MDPLGVLSDVVDASSLPKWSDTPSLSCSCHCSEGARPVRSSPFPFCKEVNEKVVLWLVFL